MSATISGPSSSNAVYGTNARDNEPRVDDFTQSLSSKGLEAAVGTSPKNGRYEVVVNTTGMSPSAATAALATARSEAARFKVPVDVSQTVGVPKGGFERFAKDAFTTTKPTTSINAKMGASLPQVQSDAPTFRAGSLSVVNGKITKPATDAVKFVTPNALLGSRG